jgi:hypothetical protein
MNNNKVFEKKIMTKKEDPCWEGYHMVGMKDKDGHQVPNCVPNSPKKESTMKITSKDILEALINKTISIQEARLIINEAYGEESYGHGEGYRYDDDPESDMAVEDIKRQVMDYLVYEEGWRVEDCDAVFEDADKIHNLRASIRNDLEDGVSVQDIVASIVAEFNGENDY